MQCFLTFSLIITKDNSVLYDKIEKQMNKINLNKNEFYIFSPFWYLSVKVNFSRVVFQTSSRLNSMETKLLSRQQNQHVWPCFVCVCV